MKITTCLLIISSFTAFAATEEQLNKKFTVQPGGRLVVDVDFGSINVSPNTTGEVTVDVWRKIGRKKKADEEGFLRDNPVIVSQEGDTVTVRSRHKSQSNRHWFWGSDNSNEAKYVITVPAQFDAGLKTSGGAIAVSDLTGTVNANTSGGGMDFKRLHGPLDGDTSGGDIRVTDCQGTIKIQTSGGGLTVTGASGSLNGDTSGGGITVKDFHGPARVQTSGGDLKIEGVAGNIEGTTSGGSIAAILSSPLAGDVRLETSGGGVTARIAANVAFELDAESSGGDVSSDLPVTVVGKIEHGQLKGAVNGGGKLVLLHTSGGSIRVEKAPGQTAERQ
jgi:DUF4097 and DUF4098 domain-containing protein YvlB